VRLGPLQDHYTCVDYYPAAPELSYILSISNPETPTPRLADRVERPPGPALVAGAGREGNPVRYPGRA